jgi:branched-chain amino acid transport system permease protein
MNMISNNRKIKKNTYIIGAVILVIVALLIVIPQFVNLYTVILLTSLLMYIVLTVSWTIFSGSTGYISLATAAFFGIGVYSAAVLGKQMPMVLIILLSGVISFGVAALVGALTLRLRGIYFTMFTLGLVELIRNVLTWYEVKFTGTRGRFVVVTDTMTIYYLMLAIFIVLIITTFLIRRSKFGLALQSIGDQEEAAAHSGVNVTSVKVVTFAISAFFMGAAGAVMATKWTYIDPGIAFNLNLSFLPALMAIFGGMTSLWGPVVGGAIFAYLEERLTTDFPYYYMLIFGVIMAITILYLPGGLFGLVQKLRRLKKADGDLPTTLDAATGTGLKKDKKSKLTG